MSRPAISTNAQDAPAAPRKKMQRRRVVRWTAAVLGALVLVAAVIVFAPFGYLVASRASGCRRGSAKR
ncbi:MAG TPA: hypothetical protein VHZ03_33060 [Trebonia sp.]|jgi:hypothetical protein|nr:hypothetical protein [Trebonia sp.]